MKKLLIDYLIVTIGIFIVAISFNIFFLSFEMVISGSSGISIILDHLFGIDPAIFILLAQVVALICGYFLLDFKHIKNSIYGTFLYPLAIDATAFLKEVILNYNIPKEDFLVFIIMGSVISGLAYGYVYKRGYTTGGSDILIQIMNKYTGQTIGTAGIIFNVSVILTGGFFLGFEKVLYTILIIYISSKMQDLVLLGNRFNKMLIINSKHKDEINKHMIKENIHSTQISAEGGFLSHKNDLIMCLVSNNDYYKLKNQITKIDPKAFLVVSHAYEYNPEN